MAINPMALLKLKDRFSIFNREHPRVVPFFRSIRENGLVEGAILELTVKTGDGKEQVTNIRLTPNDVETLKLLGNLK